MPISANRVIGEIPHFCTLNMYTCHGVKSVRIQSFSGPYFPAFGLNTEVYRVNFRIQTECGKRSEYGEFLRNVLLFRLVDLIALFRQ